MRGYERGGVGVVVGGYALEEVAAGCVGGGAPGFESGEGGCGGLGCFSDGGGGGVVDGFGGAGLGHGDGGLGVNGLVVDPEGDCGRGIG